MSFGGLTARKWLLRNAEDWTRWTRGSGSTRLDRAERMARAIAKLTLREASDPAVGRAAAAALPDTLGRCDELAFESMSETLAYATWHLVDRYARVLQVLDNLATGGHLPLRRTRFAALEVGAGPMPALHAIRDFYADFAAWAHTTDGQPPLVPATHLYPLDRGPAWDRLAHRFGEELIDLGDKMGPHVLSMAYRDFKGFSIKQEHRRAVERLAQAYHVESDRWDEYLPLREARNLASASHAYSPGAMDLIVISNFLTQREMTQAFADELTLLSRALSPGGVLVLIGSAAPRYDAIFDDFAEIVGRSLGVQKVPFPDSFDAHRDRRLHALVSQQLRECTTILRRAAPEVFESVVHRLPPTVLSADYGEIIFPRFRAAAFRNEPHLAGLSS